MGARQDEQRSVCRIRAIQMQAQSQHVLKNAHGWLDVGNAVLDRPGPEPVPVETLADGDRQVLVPTDKPVGARQLIEEEGAGGEGACADDGFDQRPQRFRDIAHARAAPKQVAEAVNSARRTCCLERGYQIGNGLWRKRAAPKRESPPFDLGAIRSCMRRSTATSVAA
jgi:hypothetical protein